MHKLFIDFVTIRNNRFELIGEDCTYEKSIETVEGTAEYVKLKALYILNQYSYEKQVSVMVSRLNSIGLDLLDTRTIAYYSGALVCLLADELNLNYKRPIAPNLDFNYDLIGSLLKMEMNSEMEISQYTEIHDLILENDKSTIQCVKDIIENENVAVIEGDFQVKGYDPMNMKRIDKYVYHKHFLGISKDDVTEFVLGPTVIETDGKDFKRFFRYYRVDDENVS